MTSLSSVAQCWPSRYSSTYVGTTAFCFSPLVRSFAHDESGEVLEDFLIQRTQLAGRGDKRLRGFNWRVNGHRVGSRFGIHSKSVVNGFWSLTLCVL